MRRLALVLLALAWLRVEARAHDWVDWRGPEQNGVSRERGLPDRWSPDPEAANSNLIWKNSYGGRSTPLVMNGRVYIINGAGDGPTQQERVMCFDAENGKVLWEYKFNVFYTDIVAVRLGWTNLAGDPETGNVYAHGTQGLFFCFNKDGKIVWSRSLTEEYGRISGYGGRVTSPVVDGDLVIVTMLNASWGEQARGGDRVLAMDKRTGHVVWWGDTGGQPKDTYYSVPVVAVIGGQRLLITGGGDGGVHAFKVRTGERVWSYYFGTGAVNCSPVVEGDRVYIAQGEENLDSNTRGQVVCLDGAEVRNSEPRLVWKKDGIQARYVSPILHAGRLYVCDDVANLFCLDAETGKQLWRYKYGRNSKGSPVWADGKIYVAEVNSKFHILQPGAKGCKELHAQFFRSPDGVAAVEVNGSPAVANGRVYFMTSEEIYCIGKKGEAVPADPIPPRPKEQPADPNAMPAHLQVVPADMVVYPGGHVEFKARAYDDHGRFLREVGEVQWAPVAMLAPPPGPPPPVLQAKVTSDGKLTVAEAPPGQFGGVEARTGDLRARARVRVAPRLPYKQDFAKIPENRSPAGWVNTQGKFAVVSKDGAKVLKKLAVNPSPLVARAYAYVSTPEQTDYTIEADLMGARKGGDMSDMGVVNCRYMFMLDGNKQYLRLVSWEALPRVDKTVSWRWDPGVWYHMRLNVEFEGGKAVVRGKIWKRGDEEPRDWTLKVEDATPNREGSPALYGYATGIGDNEPGAEVYYANVSVTPNHKGGPTGSGRDEGKKEVSR